jgi:hypothetical protein
MPSVEISLEIRDDFREPSDYAEPDHGGGVERLYLNPGLAARPIDMQHGMRRPEHRALTKSIHQEDCSCLKTS